MMKSTNTAVLLLSLAGCGHQMVGWQTEDTDVVLDTTAPTVIETMPANLDVDVALNTAVIATFSEAMDPASLTGATFTLADGITTAGTVSARGDTAVLYPTVYLEPDTEYTATITSAAQDLAGNRLAADYSWRFTTSKMLDTLAPTVIFTDPESDETGVQTDATVLAIFSEPMDPLTLSTATFTLFDGTVARSGTVTPLGDTVSFDPDLPLAPGTEYTATLQSEASDLAGNAMAADYSWQFITAPFVDLTRPTVTFTDPGTDETGVPVDVTVLAIFSEPMDPLTLSASTFTLSDGTVTHSGLVTPLGDSVSFDPDQPLSPGTEYTATLQSEASDLAGNNMAADYSWQFVTAPYVDLTAPTVTFTDPESDETGVPTDVTVLAIFSEPMDPLTLTTATFTLTDGTVESLGTVTAIGDSMTFDADVALAPNTEYTATITSDASDLYGNNMAADYTWQFTTAPYVDLTPPTVISTDPMSDEIDVPFDAVVLAVFSEDMDPLTLDTTSFTLYDGLVPIEGTVSPLGNTVVFQPTVDLSPDTVYTATITTDATDLEGLSLAADYSWDFTTAPFVDIIPPTVISTDPLDLAIDVSVDTLVMATFSEDMDSLTIDDTTFLLEDSTGLAVTGIVSYDSLTMSATFAPDTQLLPLTTYTATITMGAEDLIGLGLEEDYVWTFTTGEIPSVWVPVDLGSLTTFVAVAGAGLTNSNSSGITTLNGDVGLYPTATCLGDGSPCTLTNPVIAGTLYAADAGGIAAQAKIDLTAAYVDAMGRPPGTTVSDLSGMTLPPGVYTSSSTMSIAVGGEVILDGEGDENAVWIFQIGSSLTVNNNAQILLINGARSKNVFWAAFASSTLGSEVGFQGTVMAGASNSVGTDSVVVGRLLCTTGQITLLSNNITLPPDF